MLIEAMIFKKTDSGKQNSLRVIERFKSNWKK